MSESRVPDSERIYDYFVDPVSFSVVVSAVLASVDWKQLSKGLVTDATSKGAKALLGRLGLDERKKAARKAVELFVYEFLTELEDKVPLTSSLPGYQDQLKRLVEDAAHDIILWLDPGSNDVDLGPVQRMWGGLGLDPLPEGFDWTLVSKGYGRAIRKYLKNDPAMRGMLDTALLEQQTELQRQSTESLARIAGPAVGFDLPGYRNYLKDKCEGLQLSSIHRSVLDRRIGLQTIFVPQNAREAVPMRELSRELLRQLRQEGHITRELAESEMTRVQQEYWESPIGSVLDILARNRLTVILGDPGSGKTSLLKFMVIHWAAQDAGQGDAKQLPIWINLKEYAQERVGLLKYCESGCATYGLDSREVDKRLNSGTAALYLDSLDEIFDGPTRGSVIEEIATIAARYAQAPVVVTSRIIGYEADHLRNAGFTHATLEDFDDTQLSAFLAKWHAAVEDNVKERTRIERKLEKALWESRAIRDLAGNPLLLTIMAILNRSQDLPRDRVQLYKEISRLMLHEWDANRSLPVSVLAWQEKEELLRELAGVMQQNADGMTESLIDRSRLVDLCRTFLKNLDVSDPYEKAILLVREFTERNFILCYAGANRYSFVHRTFLEYFCAARFAELLQNKHAMTSQQLREDVFGLHWKDKAWHEVLRLIAGMVGENDAENLIRFLMKQDSGKCEAANLMLAAGCLGEVRNRGMVQSTDEALWEQFVNEAIRYDAPPGEPRRKLYELIPIRDYAAQLIAVVWRSTKALVWLRSAATTDSDPLLRSAAMHELVRGWKDDPETLVIVRSLARSDTDLSVQSDAVKELARRWKDDPDTLALIKTLISARKHTFVERTAVQELARGWKDDPETLALLKALAQPDTYYYLRAVAVEELARGWKSEAETYPWLISVIRSSSDSYVRRFAVHALAENWRRDAMTLQVLKDVARSDASDEVRGSAAGELVRSWNTNDEALAVALEFIHSHPDDGVRAFMVEELARRWKEDPQTLPTLRKLIRSDPSKIVRMSAAYVYVQGWMADILI